MKWHIITGEYPPQPGGVGDYTYLLANGLAAAGDAVHVWTPMDLSCLPPCDQVELHRLPTRFGLRWLLDLHRGIRRYPEPKTVLVQYVPHMYGWKSMNIAFCCWLATQRRQNVWVMFHEVAFPFKSGQPWRHALLAFVHRIMAWSILRFVNKAFSSTEHYLKLLERLSPARASLSLLRIFSNVSYSRSEPAGETAQNKRVANRQHVVGVFSSFDSGTCDLLQPILLKLVENLDLRILLVGPASRLVHSLRRELPALAGRIGTTGRVNAFQAGSYLRTCDALLQLYPDGATSSHGTLLAALASGVPVVTAPGPCTEPLLRDSEAIAFAENNPEAICAKVQSLLADRVLADKLGARSLQLYERHFDISNAIATLRLSSETSAPAGD